MDMRNSKSAAILIALVVICSLTAAALMHKSSPAPAAFAPVADLSTAQAATNYPSALQAPAAVDDGYYPTLQRPLYVHQQQPVAVSGPGQQYITGQAYPGQAYPGQAYQGQAGYSSETRYRTRTVYEERPGYHHGRSKAHSVEIVAGTAGVGAAIGAIAGGGKGAAIGALSGAGAGFAYDRLTHNH